MKPIGICRGFVDGLLSRCRPWLRPLQVIATALLLSGVPVGAGAREVAAAPAAGAHVYLLRGVLNIFSLGLDEIAAKLPQQGINLTIANYLSYPPLASDAPPPYRRLRT